MTDIFGINLERPSPCSGLIMTDDDDELLKRWFCADFPNKPMFVKNRWGLQLEAFGKMHVYFWVEEGDATLTSSLGI